MSTPLDQLAAALSKARSFYGLGDTLPLLQAGIADAAKRINDLERRVKELERPLARPPGGQAL
jgi:hypothetical protein